MRSVDVSIVVSTHQRRALLARTLDSLLDQRTPPDVRYEIIVVDNDCADGTRELVADRIRQYPDRVRYAHEPRRGVSFGRNAGIRASRGEIVAFTDDDNVATPTWVATIVQLMREHPEIAGVGGKVLPRWPHTPPAWLDRRHWSPLAILDYGERRFFTSAYRPLCLLTANLAVRRDVLTELGGFSSAFRRCQDHELLLRLWRGGHRILYAPELVTFAPIDPVRLTRRYHRYWHRRHGYYAAGMRLEEVIDQRGQLRATPPDSARLLGSPGFLYASTATHAWKWARAVVHRERARAAHHEHRVGYLVTYMWRSAILSYRQGDPLVREAAAFAVSHLRRRAGLVNMSAARLVLAHAVVAIILAGAAYDITTGREHWPFSPYPMFSTVERASTLDSLMLTGVTADGVAREMTLRDPSSIGPFDQCRLNTALERAASSDDGGARLHAMLEDCLTRYEAERQSGAHDGPPLRAMRVYGAHWTLDRDAKNVETPDTRRLLDEAVVAGASH